MRIRYILNKYNLEGSENVVDEDGNVIIDGYAVKVRNAMLAV